MHVGGGGGFRRISKKVGGGEEGINDTIVVFTEAFASGLTESPRKHVIVEALTVKNSNEVGKLGDIFFGLLDNLYGKVYDVCIIVVLGQRMLRKEYLVGK